MGWLVSGLKLFKMVEGEWKLLQIVLGWPGEDVLF